MIKFESILTTFIESIIFRGQWGSIENCVKLKIKPSWEILLAWICETPCRNGDREKKVCKHCLLFQGSFDATIFRKLIFFALNPNYAACFNITNRYLKWLFICFEWKLWQFVFNWFKLLCKFLEVLKHLKRD